jgi:hypothetical protein
MNESRCTSCRNRIKSHHQVVVQPSTGLVFHDDCWSSFNEVIQDEYRRRIGDEGLEGLLSPYVVRLLPPVEVRAEVPAEPEPDLEEVEALEAEPDPVDDDPEPVAARGRAAATFVAGPSVPNQVGEARSVVEAV